VNDKNKRSKNKKKITSVVSIAYDDRNAKDALSSMNNSDDTIAP